MQPVQEVTETAATDLGALLDAGDDATVTLVAGDTRLVAHRAVLAARSPVFEAMFRHETLEAGSGRVCIPDVEGPVLRQLVAYMYTTRAAHPPGMAPQLLVAAEKYGLPLLKAECERQVAAQLCVETAATTAVLAVRHSCVSLKQTAVDFIRANFGHVVGTQGWADAMLSQPEDFIEVSRLLSEPPPRTSASAPCSDHSGQPSASADLHTSTPDDAAISGLRSLSWKEKGSRLIVAAKRGAVDDLQTLLAAGADVGVRDRHKDDTPLHWAARRGHVLAVQCLLRSGAEVDARNSWQSTPLLLAAQYGHKEVVAALLEAGADTGATDGDGDTPLVLAQQGNHRELVEMLNGR